MMATRAATPAVPLDLFLSTLPSYPRPVLARLTARLIDHLDEVDGDPDLEEDNEDCGHDEGEPDFRKRPRHRRNFSGPGCNISDPDYGAEDVGEAEDPR
jgi:hypothetical protein